MTLLETLKQNNPEFCRIDVSPIFGEGQQIVGWDSVAYSFDEAALAGGTHQDQSVAIRICIAEALERVFAEALFKNDVMQAPFLLSDFPSTCGFACGFQNEKTKHRAIAEALERWAWSQWIDCRCLLQIIEKPNFNSLLLDTLYSRFSNSTFFRKKFLLDGFEYVFGVFIGFSDDGAFAGSRVCASSEDPWQHALIEASRNLRNHELAMTKSIGLNSSEIVRLRAIFFGNHKEEALAQIEMATKTEWRDPKIRLLKEYDTQINGVYLWRCLMHDWVGWHLGDEKRFVY